MESRVARASFPPTIRFPLPRQSDEDLQRKVDELREENRQLAERLKNLREVKIEAEEKRINVEGTFRIAKAEYTAAVKHLYEYAAICEAVSEKVQNILKEAVEAHFPCGRPLIMLKCNDCFERRGKLPWYMFPLRIFQNEGGYGFSPYCVDCKNRRMQQARWTVALGADMEDGQSIEGIAGEIVDRGPSPLLDAICDTFLASPEGGDE